MAIQRKDGDPEPDYGDEMDAFTLKVHHGGRILVQSENKNDQIYVGGEVTLFDWVSKDYFSLLELADIMNALGIKDSSRLYYEVEEVKGKKVFQLITSDKEALLMANNLGIGRVASIFVSVPPSTESSTPVTQMMISEWFGPINDSLLGEALNEVLSRSQTTSKQHESNTLNIDSSSLGEETKCIDNGGVTENVEIVNVSSAENKEEEGLEQIEADVPKDDLIDSDYEQDQIDIAQQTCIDPTTTWEGFHVPNMSTLRDVETDDSAYEDSDDLRSMESDEDELDPKGKRKKYSDFNPEHDLKDPKFRIGMKFPNIDVFRQAVREHSIKHHKGVKFEKNDSDRVRAKCKRKECPFVMYASVLPDKKTFMIKTLNLEHTCLREFRNRFVNSTWMAQKYVEQFRAQPNWSLSGFAAQVRNDTMQDVTPAQFYRAKKLATKAIQGDTAGQYFRLWDYCEELKRSNPGSTVKMMCDTFGEGNPKFRRIYVCLAALKKGWKEGCRPILGLDGCFIKGHHTGQCLSAVGIDPNNQTYPVAYAVVESEDEDSWTWFLELLEEDLQLNNSHQISWISDKQKGLINTIKYKFKHSEHRNCVRHLHNNFKGTHKGLYLKQLMWSAAKSTTVSSFEGRMNMLKEESLLAFEWFNDKPPKHWSRAFFKTRPKCDILCNNLCEAFNSAIVPARDKPIITLLEMVRNYLMQRMVRKREKVTKWKEEVGPKILKIIQRIQIECVSCIPSYCGNGIWQVTCFNSDQFVVDTIKKTCACRKWDLVGIPCIHAMSAIMKAGKNPLDFVDPSYKKEAFLKAYTPVIVGINGPELWPKTNYKPVQYPEFKKQKGRPKKQRRLEPDEIRLDGTTKLKKGVYTEISCTNCYQLGHNRKYCHHPPVEQPTQEKKKPGRPRKKPLPKKQN